MNFWWIAAAAFISSIITTIMNNRRRTYGTLLIDHSNPEKDVYKIVIHEDLDKLQGKNRVELKINHHADLSHE